jgi:hypothetical protein
VEGEGTKRARRRHLQKGPPHAQAREREAGERGEGERGEGETHLQKGPPVVEEPGGRPLLALVLGPADLRAAAEEVQGGVGHGAGGGDRGVLHQVHVSEAGVLQRGGGDVRLLQQDTGGGGGGMCVWGGDVNVWVRKELDCGL